MKLPKGFGGQGFQGAIQQAQAAMAKAEQLEEELAQLHLPIDKGPVKAVFTGTGEMVAISIDPVVVDPEDVEALEDLVLSAVRDGFAQSTALRNAKVQQIVPKIPGLT